MEALSSLASLFPLRHAVVINRPSSASRAKNPVAVALQSLFTKNILQLIRRDR